MRNDEILERGTAVRVQCARGRTVENVVWEDHGEVVLVCGPAQFEHLRAGYPAPMPIGFRREDVAAIGDKPA